MRLDLSSVDAELESLGRAPENAAALARTFAGIDTARLQLDQIDRELGLLAAKIEGLAHDAAENRRAPEWAPAPAFKPAAPPLSFADSEPVPAFKPAAPLPAFTDSEPAPAFKSAAPLPAFADSEPAPAFKFKPAVPPPPSMDSDPAPRFESGPAPAQHEPESERPAGNESWPPLSHMEPSGPEHDDSPTSAVHSVPPPALTQSQEIVLPDPIARDELSSESGELRLDDDKPTSGSFSLDAEAPEPTTQQPPPRGSLKGPHLPSFATDDVGDALEGSQPLSMGGEPKLLASKPAPFAFDRDPDAEFDALLSEATDPNGMPTDGATREAEELVHGLADDELDDDELHTEIGTADYTPVTSAGQLRDADDELALLLLEDADSTEVLDRSTLGDMEAQGPAGPTIVPDAQDDTLTELSGELEMGELEIVMDETPTKAPPPPPPPPATSEKRPSLLGRFFGRDRE